MSDNKTSNVIKVDFKNKRRKKNTKIKNKRYTIDDFLGTSSSSINTVASTPQDISFPFYPYSNKMVFYKEELDIGLEIPENLSKKDIHNLKLFFDSIITFYKNNKGRSGDIFKY